MTNTYSQKLPKLSKTDHEKVGSDLLLYGNAYIQNNLDGTGKRIDPFTIIIKQEKKKSMIKLRKAFIGRFLCKLGFHKWFKTRTSDGYRVCSRTWKSGMCRTYRK
jgi:hypothetical protein